MADIVCARFDWDRQSIKLPLARYHAIHIMPEPGYPCGRRGLAMMGAWSQLGEGCEGMLCLDGDVAIDPVDHDAMFAAIDKEPGAVHVAPVKLWPTSTHLDGWVWGHGQNARFSAKDPSHPDCFTFCFTYLPRCLLELCIKAGMDEWMYPGVDKKVSEVARGFSIPIRVVRNCQPKHVNF